MADETRKRRPKGPAAIGNIDQTKLVVDKILGSEADERRKKTERLRALRFENSPDEPNAEA